ncbi:hypothetical protein I4B00_004534 [Enterobacter asburiae]|nr:hypothetical protein [Enterobacter asburiae]
MNVNTPAAAPMAFFVPSHNAVYDRATQLEGQWVTQREAITLESLRRLYPDAELIPAIFVRYGARFFECHDLHTRHHRELIGDVIARFCLDAPLNSAH